VLASYAALLQPPQIVQTSSFVQPVSWTPSQLVQTSTGVFPIPTTGILARVNAASGPVDLSSFLDEVDSSATAEATAKADAMRAKIVQAEADKDAKAAIALARMEAVKAAKKAEIERLEASDVPPCPTGGPWGDGSTGFGQAKACTRVRDGNVGGSQRTGFFLVF